MKKHSTAAQIMFVNLLVIYMILQIVFYVHAKDYHFALVQVIVMFVTIFFGYPRTIVRVEHYKLNHLLNNSGPQLESTYPGSSFHLNGVQMIIKKEIFDESDDGRSVPISLLLVPANNPELHVVLAYPSLLPYGGEEFEFNLKRLSEIYNKCRDGQEA